MRHFRLQLIDSLTQLAIQAAGGKCFVAQTGTAKKATLYDSTGAALANPLTPNYGIVEFYTADTVSKVDLYIMAPSGHFVVAKNIVASGPNALFVDLGRVTTTLVIPFSATDQTGDNTETLTGFVLPGSVQPSVAVDISAIDATEDVDVGTDSGSGGDADCFIDGVSVGTLGYTKATLANGAVTLGVKLFVQDSANAGDAAPEQDIAEIGKEVSYTLSAGADTAQGFIQLNVNLPATVL